MGGTCDRGVNRRVSRYRVESDRKRSIATAQRHDDVVDCRVDVGQIDW
jgi:hypothetical protein